ncbi:RluA family pseudouridine synthase [Novacetimonas pomaceti]|uniref:RluA family pseudouridine synthase n=1 Tax=Novacetimonas pomaceti TaxID=2021998 RepID=UPI001C2DE990|nr:RluA family pseudouridine synthase [Novacetimonas pomaceti]MBV1834865.1 RluA family pseudouridine synthase [Novacetimonas pomaceti]
MTRRPRPFAASSPSGPRAGHAPLPFPVLFRDRHFIVIDKPAGLPAHPGRDGGPSVEDAFALMSRHRNGPWLAHRLDRDTSGCLLVALRKQALVAAQSCFANGEATKVYWAITHGHPPGAHGVIDAPLLRREGRGGWRIETDPRGQAARTAWRCLARGHMPDGSPASWLELRLGTGRTHQARVHCATLGCPVMGDGQYGPADGKSLHLMSRELHLPLAPSIHAVAAPPPHMRHSAAQAGWDLDQQPSPPHDVLPPTGPAPTRVGPACGITAGTR